MHFLIATNFVRNMPWAPCWWAVALARGLRARGHTVTVAADGTECPWLFDGCELRVARPMRVHLGAHPGRFVSLVARAADELPDAVLLSLTPLIRGRLWLPLEPTPGAVLRRLTRDLKPISLALELLHHPWLPFESLAAWRARGGRRLEFGADLPRVSLLGDDEARAASEAAPAIRRALALSGVCAVMPAVDVRPRILAPVLREFAGLEGLTLLIPTSRPHTIAGLAPPGPTVIPLGLTATLPAIAAACDFAIAGPAAGDAGGRWIADCLRLGVPVLAHPSAAGVDLLAGGGGGVAPAGAWPAALAAAMARGRGAWDPRVSGAVRLEVLLERLERLGASAMVAPRG